MCRNENVVSRVRMFKDKVKDGTITTGQKVELEHLLLKHGAMLRGLKDSEINKLLDEGVVCDSDKKI